MNKRDWYIIDLNRQTDLSPLSEEHYNTLRVHSTPPRKASVPRIVTPATPVRARPLSHNPDIAYIEEHLATQVFRNFRYYYPEPWVYLGFAQGEHCFQRSLTSGGLPTTYWIEGTFPDLPQEDQDRYYPSSWHYFGHSKEFLCIKPKYQKFGGYKRRKGITAQI